jgi:ankyrin repeat protein
VGGPYGSALQAAAENGSEQVVQLLLDAGADVNIIGGYFGSALQAAAANGGEQVVRLLLDAGADVNSVGGPYGSPLQEAVKNDHTNISKLLRLYGAKDVETTTSRKRSYSPEEVRGLRGVIHLVK